MIYSPRSGITCMVRNKRIKITRDLIRSILELEYYDLRLFSSKTIPHLEGYNFIEACCRVIGKHFESPAQLSTNQLTLSCRVLHNIISHIIVPRNGHIDEVNHYDLFLLDSILVERKLDFSYIMLNHMNTVHRGHRPMALPYGVILTKIFQHFEVYFHDEVVLNPKPTNTINILTLKCMRIFKEDGQWVAKTKRFDEESGPSTLSFEGGEEMDADEDAPPPRPRSHRPSSSTFTEDDFNRLNGWIDLLTSTVEGLYQTVENLQQSVDGMTSLLQVLHFRIDFVLPPQAPLSSSTGELVYFYFF
ncbi:Uncharacterized protein Adt_42353 [Abeliophyllum distichum]|uniref:Putative plant transposon protein domain-containing protein n=1 Tax=Abeliophyllum distichum TaxID=126358 RepID=A0ABD1PRF3_9LAMI